MAFQIASVVGASGATYPNAYARVSNVVQGLAKLPARYIVAIYASKAAAEAGGSPVAILDKRPGIPGATPLSFTPNYAADAPNLMQQAYTDAATLPQLAGATQVLEAGQTP